MEELTFIRDIHIVDTIFWMKPISVHVPYLTTLFLFDRYSVASNAIASSYAALSLVLATSGKKGVMSAVIILDLLMVAMLFSSNGAALAIGLMGYQGNSHVMWAKVCTVFGRFCNQAAVSIALSLLGSILFLLLVAMRLHKISK